MRMVKRRGRAIDGCVVADANTSALLCSARIPKTAKARRGGAGVVDDGYASVEQQRESGKLEDDIGGD